MENGKMIVDGVNLHINNGGVNFRVTEDDYLALEIRAGHFGNITNSIKLYVNHDALRKLGQMLIEAADKQDAKVNEYFTVECFGFDKDTGKTKRLDGQENVSREFSLHQQNEAAAGTTASDEQGIQGTINGG
jgi:RNA binding exosome subunit